MSLTKHFQIMSVIFFILCVDIIQANIVTDKFRKVGGCGAVSMAPVYHKEMKSTSCIHCLTQCSRIHKCNSVIYQSSTKTCIFYGANEGTCPSTNGRAVNMYKRDTVSSDFLSTVTKDTVTSSSEQIGEGTSHTVQHEDTQNQQSNTLTASSTQSTNIPTTVRSVTTNDNCVNGNYNQGLLYPRTCICNDGFMGENCNERFKSCTDWFKYGKYLKNRDGTEYYNIYYSHGYSRQWITIQPPNSPQPFQVQCRCRYENINTYIYINTEKARYTLDRFWSDMKTGFDFEGGYWIGLNHLYDVYTYENSNELSMKIVWEDRGTLRDTEIMLYDDLKIGNETSNYQIQYKKYVSDYDSRSFSDLNGAMFSAKDKDNDRVSDSNCASTNKRAFWYNGTCRPDADDKILILIKLTKPCVCWN